MDKEKMEKEIRLMELEEKATTMFPLDYWRYYEWGSTDNIDERIRVFEQLTEGKEFESIPGAMNLLVGYPNGEEDGVKTVI